MSLRLRRRALLDRANVPASYQHVWTAAFPGTTENTDGPYEMGTICRPNVAVTIYGVRIWMHTGAQTITSRKARLWDYDTQTVLRDVFIDDAPWSGWKDFLFASPISRAAPVNGFDTTQWVLASFHARGYGATGSAFATQVDSADGAVTMVDSNYLGSNNPRNGRYNTTPGSFPTSWFNSTFYGVDVLYTAP